MHVAAVEKVTAQLRARRARARRQPAATSWCRSWRGAATCACARRSWASTSQGNERVLLERIKELESQGYQFEAAEGSFELLVRRSAPGYQPPFEVLDVVVISERRRGNSMFAEATVKLRIGDEVVHTVAEGDGPGARARRRVPQGAEPALPAAARASTWSTTRSASWTPRRRPAPRRACCIEAARGEERWSTIGVSPNIIEAAPRRSPTRWSCRSRAPAPPARPTTKKAATLGARRRPHASSPLSRGRAVAAREGDRLASASLRSVRGAGEGAEEGKPCERAPSRPRGTPASAFDQRRQLRRDMRSGHSQ